MYVEGDSKWVRLYKAVITMKERINDEMIDVEYNILLEDRAVT